MCEKEFRLSLFNKKAYYCREDYHRALEEVVNEIIDIITYESKEPLFRPNCECSECVNIKRRIVKNFCNRYDPFRSAEPDRFDKFRESLDGDINENIET